MDIFSLRIGDVVTWDGDEEDTGTVCALSPNAVCVDWDDGQVTWPDRSNEQELSYPVTSQ